MKKTLRKGVQSKGGNFQKLSKEQQKVYVLLVERYLTVKQIAQRRKTSLSAVYKIIRKLKNKGIINYLNKGSKINECTFEPPLKRKNAIRLHGLEINARILYKSTAYYEQFNKKAKISIDNNTIRLYKRSIEIYIKESFYSDSVEKAAEKGIIYLQRLLVKLENRLKISLFRHNSDNIHIVKQHYSEINNEIAKDMDRRGNKIRIYCKEDGKLWFTIDNSFNLHEAETLHPKTAKRDMIKLKAFFDDIRDNELVKMSEIISLIKTIKDALKYTSVATKNSTDNINVIIKYLGLDHKISKKDIERFKVDKKPPEYVG